MVNGEPPCRLLHGILGLSILILGDSINTTSPWLRCRSVTMIQMAVIGKFSLEACRMLGAEGVHHNNVGTENRAAENSVGVSMLGSHE
jgi:hypothetical protein